MAHSMLLLFSKQDRFHKFTAGTTRKDKMTAEEKEHRSKLLQIICYFRSTYEVLLDADEHLSTLLGPADLLEHLRVLVRLDTLQLVPVLKYLVCWPIARWLRQEMPELPTGCPPEVECTPLKLFSKRPRTHLKNLLVSRTNNRAKRGLPEIPAEFILASKVKHAKALQKDLPPMDEARPSRVEGSLERRRLGRRMFLQR